MADISKITLPNGSTYDIVDNKSGYTKNTGTITKVQTTAGAHTAIDVSSGAANFNVPTAAAHVGAVADCTISLYNGKSGNPGACKFCTVDYSSCDSNNGVLVKITMMAGHGNGTSYNHYQDAIISVGYTGTVSVNIFRYYAQSVTYENTTHYYGDIFYTIDTTNKVVTFYDLMGQYSHVNQAPYKKMNGSGKGTVTQFSGTAVHYSSGTKTYANVFWMDGSTKQNTLVSGTNIKTVNSNSLVGSGNVSVGTVTGVTAGSGLSGGGTSGSVTLNHSNSVTAGTIGSSSATSGATVSIPYATYDSNGHITGKGTHTHTITGFFSKDDILSVFYPVGSYYETSDTSFNPNTAWGGTWVLESAGNFHVSAGTGYTAGSTGGSADAIVPYHRHSVSITSDSGTSHSHGAGTGYRFMRTKGSLGRDKVSKGTSTTQKYVYATDDVSYTTNTAGESSHTHSVSGNTEYTPSSDNKTGANMPPYIAVNRWHRTA